jgi:hypothetical protein
MVYNSYVNVSNKIRISFENISFGKITLYNLVDKYYEKIYEFLLSNTYYSKYYGREILSLLIGIQTNDTIYFDNGKAEPSVGSTTVNYSDIYFN